VTTAAETMRQQAPYPRLLAELLAGLTYKVGWYFSLRDLDRGQGSAGLTLVIEVDTPDSYHPQRRITVAHYMPVPPAAYDERSWRRWLFDQIGLVELHERCEFFTIGGDKPYAPSHGPGNDPYLVREVGTDADRRTSFRGELNPARPRG
jgi:hypothetical protein